MPKRPVEIQKHKPAISDLQRVQAQIDNDRPLSPEVLLKTGIDRQAVRQYAAAALVGVMNRVGISLARNEVAHCFDLALEMVEAENAVIAKESLR